MASGLHQIENGFTRAHTDNLHSITDGFVRANVQPGGGGADFRIVEGSDFRTVEGGDSRIVEA